MLKKIKTTMEMPEYSGCLTELAPTLDKELQPYLVEIKTLTQALKPEYVHINATTQGMQLMANCPVGKQVFRDRDWNLFVYARTRDEVEAVMNADLDQARGNKSSTTYQVKATYRYVYKNQSYFGDRVSLSFGSDNIGSFHERKYNEIKRYLNQKKPFPVHVNPENPSEAGKPRADFAEAARGERDV